MVGNNEIVRTKFIEIDLGFYNVPNSANQANAIYFDNYEMAHFRLLTDTNFLPYGRSYLEPGRKLFKQYTMMEDAMLIHRIVRAPEKRIFYINFLHMHVRTIL